MALGRVLRIKTQGARPASARMMSVLSKMTVQFNSMHSVPNCSRASKNIDLDILMSVCCYILAIFSTTFGVETPMNNSGALVDSPRAPSRGRRRAGVGVGLCQHGFTEWTSDFHNNLSAAAGTLNVR